jgi:FAD/FMN-containing dehydrogenase
LPTYNTSEEVVAVLGIAVEHRIHVVTRGGGVNCAAAMMPSLDRVVKTHQNDGAGLDIDPTTTRAIAPNSIPASRCWRLF